MESNRIVGIGIDIELIQRFREKPFAENENFYRRLFSPFEIDYCLSKKDPYPHFTARFCAKEALRKSQPAGKNSPSLNWNGAEVRNDEDGKPELRLINSRAKSLLDGCIVHISLSHDDIQAAAFIVIEKR